MLYEINAMNDEEHKTTVRMPRDLHKAARVKAIEDDVSLSEAIRRLVQGWVAGEIQLPAEEEEPEES